MSLALDAELHWLRRASTPGNTEEAQGGLGQSREALRRPEHLPGRDTSPRTSREGDMQKGQKQVRPTNFGGMLLQEAGGEDKKGADNNQGEGWGKVPLPQHVVFCRGSQLKQVFSGFQAGMPQETAPHTPQDKRKVLCVNKHHCCKARQAVNQSCLIQFPPQSNQTPAFLGHLDGWLLTASRKGRGEYWCQWDLGLHFTMPSQNKHRAAGNKKEQVWALCK